MIELRFGSAICVVSCRVVRDCEGQWEAGDFFATAGCTGQTYTHTQWHEVERYRVGGGDECPL